jgi:protein SCO1/2
LPGQPPLYISLFLFFPLLYLCAMRKKVVLYGLFFVVLLGCYLFFAFAGTDEWKTKMSVISTVKPFSFTTQDGQPFTERDMQGKVCVVEYFFTTCKGICPQLNSNMKQVYEKFRKNPSFLIVSHTCDPERDSVAQLKRYSDSLQIDNNKWVFLTGRKDSLYNQARSSYLLDDPKNGLANINDQFIHTQFFALVDKTGKVRGQVFDGLKKDEIEKMEKSIQALLEENPGAQKPFANNLFNN